MRPHGAVVELLDRLARPTGAEFLCPHLAHDLLHPADHVRDKVLVGPAARCRLAQAGATPLADRGAERLPDLIYAFDVVGRGPRERGLDLSAVLDEVPVRLTDDEAHRQEVDVAVRRERGHEFDDALVRRMHPLDDFVRGSRCARLGLARVLGVDIRERATAARKPVRHLARELLHPVRDVADHRLIGPAGRRRVRQR